MCIRKNSSFILDELRETIFSEEIILQYKNNPTDFTRNRKQPFGQMLVFIRTRKDWQATKKYNDKKSCSFFI